MGGTATHLSPFPLSTAIFRRPSPPKDLQPPLHCSNPTFETALLPIPVNVTVSISTKKYSKKKEKRGGTLIMCTENDHYWEHQTK